MKTITELLAAYKAANDLTDAQIAVRAGVGQPTVSDWIAGRRVPDDRRAEVLADMLGVSVDEAVLAISYTRRKRAESLDEAIGLITQLDGALRRLEARVAELERSAGTPGPQGPPKRR